MQRQTFERRRTLILLSIITIISCTKCRLIFTTPTLAKFRNDLSNETKKSTFSEGLKSRIHLKVLLKFGKTSEKKLESVMADKL